MYSAVVVQEVLQRRWDPWRWEAECPAIGSWQRPSERINEVYPLQLHEKLPKNSVSTILWSSDTWSKLNRWKSSISGCLMSWLKIKRKIVILKSHLLFYATTMNSFLIRLWCATKSGFYTTTSIDQLSGWTKKKLQRTSQSQNCTKKQSWSLFGGPLPIWSSTDFWISAKPLHLRSRLSKSMGCTKNCNTCSQQWSTERAQLFSTTPHVTQPMLQKLNELGYEVLSHPLYSPDLSPTDYHFFKHLTTFCRENTSTTSRGAENSFQEFTEA